MCEVTKENFNSKFPEIKSNLENSKFISIDCEFSALEPLTNNKPSLFDNSADRYLKLRNNLEHVIPLQIGLTTFHFDKETDDYYGNVYNFYCLPSHFPTLHKSFYFEVLTMKFLTYYNYDFNKLAYSGIPYMNSLQEQDLRTRLKNNQITEIDCNLSRELEEAVNNYTPTITNWYNKSKIDETLELPEILKKYNQMPDIVYFIHKNFRKKFKNLWTYVSNDCFYIQKVSGEDFTKLVKEFDLNEELLTDLKGFRKVFQLLTTLKKPIIGHNMLQDLMILVNNFETPLPKSYSEFKLLTNQLFPVIFDTKTLYYELRPTLFKGKKLDSGLSCLFNYFKNENGRHLALNSPAIDCDINPEDYGRYHEAGWDSFCTGYVFIRLIYCNLARLYPKAKNFVPSELINGVSQYKNCVNIIRGSSSHMKIDGQDPISIRPPWLVVESIKNEPVDISKITSLMSLYGFAEIKKFSSNGKRLLVAVDNFGTARQISKNLEINSYFKIKQYNFLRHSPAIRAFFWTGITISGGLLIWLSHTIIKR